MSKQVKLGLTGLAIAVPLVAFALWVGIATVAVHAPEAQAGPWVSQIKGFEVTCGSTATQIRPSTLDGPVHSVRCMMSRETPDDSTDCVCLGGVGVNDTTACYPVGGCSRAIDTTFSVDGNVYCMREDGAADAVIVCLGGTGEP